MDTATAMPTKFWMESHDLEADRAGFRSHGSWGAEADIRAPRSSTWTIPPFQMSKEELALLEDSEKKDKEKSEREGEGRSEKKIKRDLKKEDDKFPRVYSEVSDAAQQEAIIETHATMEADGYTTTWPLY